MARLSASLNSKTLNVQTHQNTYNWDWFLYTIPPNLNWHPNLHPPATPLTRLGVAHLSYISPDKFIPVSKPKHLQDLLQIEDIYHREHCLNLNLTVIISVLSSLLTAPKGWPSELLWKAYLDLHNNTFTKHNKLL